VLLEMDSEVWHRVFDGNVTSTLLRRPAAMPGMIERRSAIIGDLCSRVALTLARSR
jgi:NADP-dependent 3-hydroxy acid dehydrogenase YdfG